MIECLQLDFLASPFSLILFRVAFPAAIFHSGAPFLGLMSQSRVDSQTPISLATRNVDCSLCIRKGDVKKGSSSQDTLHKYRG